MIETTVRAVIIVTVSVGLALLGQWIVRRRVRHQELSAHTDVAGFIYAALAVIYAVVLALVVIASWEGFGRAREAARGEANAWLDLVRLAESWPPAERQLVESALSAYGQAVVADEWPAMARGELESPAAVERLRAVWRAYGELAATSPDLASGPLFSAAIDELDELDDARGQRQLAARSDLPGVMWAVLVVGGIVTVAFTYLFGVENPVAQGLMLAALTGLIALLLFLIQELSTPFAGSARIGSEAFQRVLRLATGDAA